MVSIRLLQWLIIPALLVVAFIGTTGSGAPEPDDKGVTSIHDSYVYFFPGVGGKKCFIGNTTQTFCFRAVSYTTDWEYVYYLWTRFPAGWTVNSAYVQGTPYCLNGGTFGSFGLWKPSDNEIRITHTRYPKTIDTCSAYYCFNVTSGDSLPGPQSALISWYWSGTNDGSAPFHPCSSDGYTPTGLPACDEAIWPQAVVSTCPQLYLPLVLKRL